MRDQDMDCRELEQELQTLIDGALDAAGSRRVREHARFCGACALRLGGLRLAAASAASLTRPRLGAAFNAKVLAGLGWFAQAAPMAPWTRWAVAALAAQAACGAAALAFVAFQRLTLADAVRLLAQPSELLLLARLGLARAGAALAGAAPSALRALEFVPAPAPGRLALQAGAAAALAGLLIAAVARTPRAKTHWRTV